MRGRTSALNIEMDTQTRKTLLSWLRRQKTPAGLAKRARAMLLLADGQSYSHTSSQVGLSERHLRKWAKRFITQGISGLYDSQRLRVEHEYQRKGALNLFAAFDTRTGFVWGQTYERKRQEEFIACLEYLDHQVPSHITTIHLVLDNLSVHKGKKVQAWLSQHPRFVFHYPPVHCCWLNQVEQWFSILQRKRPSIANFANKEALAERLQAFIAELNAIAHPFNWTRASVAKVMAKCEVPQPNFAIAC